MTIPRERKWAVERTEKFLMSLLDRTLTPRVPKEIRLQARSLLKHYPCKFYLEEAAKKAPEIFGNDL